MAAAKRRTATRTAKRKGAPKRKTAAKPKSAETPVWTYVGVGFVFGLLLLGVYRLVMILGH